jgi:3-oxoacyl-[acyl-carrier protein] reductase
MQKIIIITGTRKGLGKELALHFLKENNIVVGCSRQEASISNQNYIHFQIDVSDENAVVSMVRETYKQFKRIDGLINNAGTASLNHLILTPLKTINQLVNTNFLGSFLFTREVAKVMIKQKRGNIVNFSTVAVPLNLEGEAIYAATKSAIETFTKISAKELGEYGVTVNAIGPTPILTDLIKTVPKNKIDQLINNQSIKRMGTAEDVIQTIQFFMDDKSNFITGQIIYLGGINR